MSITENRESRRSRQRLNQVPTLSDIIAEHLAWMRKQGYAPHTIAARRSILKRYRSYLEEAAVKELEELPLYVLSFAQNWCQKQGSRNPERLTKELVWAIGSFLRYLRETGRLPSPAPESCLAPTLLLGLERFTQFLIVDRGLAQSTVRQWKFYAGRFLSFLTELAVISWEAIRPSHVDKFLIGQAGTLGRHAMRNVCSALRSFFRYLRIEGHKLAPLLEDFPKPRIYAQEDVPHCISPEKIKKTLALVNRGTPAGTRDYAILLLLISYGMRAGEVARLMFDDIDWSGERLCLRRRKSGRSDWMPLSIPAGEAILEYISKVRQKTDCRQIFLALQAPVRALRTGGVSTLAHKYLQAAGIQLPRCGAHIFRHTTAQQLLVHGYSFKAIGDYLGHSATSSTSVYVKIDLVGLREVALNDGEDLL